MKKENATTGKIAKLMGIREYARHRAAHNTTGATHSAVRKAIASGRLAASLVKGAENRVLIDAEKADLEWGLTTDPAQQREPDELRRAETPPTELPKQLLITGETVDASQDQNSKSGSDISDRARIVYSAQRARIASSKAEEAELDLAERRGELISAQKVADDYYKQAAKLREAILNVPKQLSKQLGPKNQKLVTSALTKVLAGIKLDADA